MTLADFTIPGLIVPHLNGQTAPEVIEELTQALQREGRVPEVRSFYQAVQKREALVSTAMEEGMAFPHARVEGLAQLSFALGRSAQPLTWGTPQGHRIRLVFLMAVPGADLGQYLSLISGLARLGKNRVLLEK